jgi:5-methylcytosine-specific restriction protein A
VRIRGALGFELPNGSGYLEAHHIINIAKQGPDKVGNVIALCAHYPREARYGRGAEHLEAFFIAKLRATFVALQKRRK